MYSHAYLAPWAENTVLAGILGHGIGAAATEASALRMLISTHKPVWPKLGIMSPVAPGLHVSSANPLRVRVLEPVVGEAIGNPHHKAFTPTGVQLLGQLVNDGLVPGAVIQHRDRGDVQQRA